MLYLYHKSKLSQTVVSVFLLKDMIHFLYHENLVLYQLTRMELSY